MTRSLALLHGFTGSPASWSAVTRLLPAEVRVLAPTLVGHGRPPVAVNDVAGFEDEVDRLAALLAHDGGPFHLAGYSLGARLGLGLLVRHPALFVSATLVGGQPGLDSAQARAERVEADARLVHLLHDQGLAAFVRHWESQPLFATQRELPDSVRAERRAERLSHTEGGLARSLEVTGLGVMPSYRDALPSLSVRATWVAGARDEKFAAIARAMAETSPLSSCELVAGVGHDVVLERPAAVAQLLVLAMGRSP